MDCRKHVAVSPALALSLLDAAAEDNAVFCVDAHLSPTCAVLEPPCSSVREWLAPQDVENVALSLAIAAQLSNLDRQVITLTGAVGGTSLIDNLSFIENAGLDLKVIVLCSGDDTDDLVARARTCGIFGRTASVPDDIVTAFVDAFDYAGPALVEIRTPQPIPRLPRRVGTS